MVEADDIAEAVKKTHRLGINPGGEVMAWDYTDIYNNADLSNGRIPLDFLLTKEDLMVLCGEENVIRMEKNNPEHGIVVDRSTIVRDDDNDMLYYLT